MVDCKVTVPGTLGFGVKLAKASTHNPTLRLAKLKPLEFLEESELMRFLIDPWFPIQGVHLIGGPSGAGKTRWLLKLIESWRRGEPFFGHPCYPRPFVYIVADRGRRDAFATFYQMKIKPKSWPIISHDDINKIENYDEIIKRALQHFPDAKVLFVEGIASLLPGGGDKASSNGAVQRFLKGLSNFNKQHDTTIIGTVHTSKAKKDSGYEIAREKILGASAWGGYANTIISLAPDNPSDPLDPHRTITILPRNSPVEQYALGFNSAGLLERVDDSERRNSVAFLAFLATRTGDLEKFTTKDVISYFAVQTPPQSIATAKRALARAEETELIARTQHGQYTRKQHDALDLQHSKAQKV